MGNVAPLQDDGSAGTRAADLQVRAAVARADQGLAAAGLGAVAEHHDADEGVGVRVPAYNRALGGAVTIGGCRGKVDVPNFVVADRHQVDAGDAGNDSQNFRVLPGLLDEGCSTLGWSIGETSEQHTEFTHDGTYPRSCNGAKSLLNAWLAMTSGARASERILRTASPVKRLNGFETAVDEMP